MWNRKLWLCGFIAAGGLILATSRVVSQDEPVEKPKSAGDKGGMPSPAEMAEMMKKCEAAGKPGEHHKVLEHFVGTWNATTRMWMDPSAPPVETKGKSVVKSLLDGRFVMDDYSSEMMLPNEKGEMSARPFKGMGVTGYDNVKNLYVGTWMDSMGTGILMMTGSFNPMTKTLSMFGTMDDVAMGIYGKTIRYEIKIVSDNKHVFTMYDCHAGVDYKVFEITYTRTR